MQLLADTIRVPESWSWLLVLLTILSTGGKTWPQSYEDRESWDVGKIWAKIRENRAKIKIIGVMAGEKKLTGFLSSLSNALPPMIFCSLVMERWPPDTRRNKENQGGRRLSRLR